MNFQVISVSGLERLQFAAGNAETLTRQLDLICVETELNVDLAWRNIVVQKLL